MLRLPQFEIVSPESVDEVVAALSAQGSRIVAGGTDILPNLKHRLDQPERLVSLSRLTELRKVEVHADKIVIGSGVTLNDVAQHPVVLEKLPSLASAAGLVASPVIRNMGTIGGNIHLDTRCRYVNQSDFWREAIGGGCLKSEGNVCHVVPGGKNCVAAMSADTVPVLISLGARIELVGPNGKREVELSDYYTANGIAHIKKEANEVMTRLIVPLPSSASRSHYVKWSVRKSIDFPLISVALHVQLERNDISAPVSSCKIAVGVLNSKPRELSGLEAVFGKTLADPDFARICGELAHKQCKPLTNVPYDAEYRRKLIPVHVKRAIAQLVERG